jgi:hypothetical protein
MGAYERIASNTATTDDLTNYSNFVTSGYSGHYSTMEYGDIIQRVAEGTIVEDTSVNRESGLTTVGEDVLKDILVSVFDYTEDVVAGMDWD